MIKPEQLADNLVELPAQPSDVPWPTEGWQHGDLKTTDQASFDKLTEEIFDLKGPQGVTYALLVIKNGELVYERYDHGANAFYLQYSWSMAKSITQALVGILVKQGRIDIYEPLGLPEWQGDARNDITLDHLLQMRSGLQFQEDYVDGAASDVIPMLMFDGRHDTGAFAAAKPLVHEPGSYSDYSSGTTNIICRYLKEVVGGGASGMLRFMNDELFEPIGIRTATPKFDTSGTFIGSSFLQAIPQDFARFGLLYLRGGSWNGREILPREWVDYARSPSGISEEGLVHSAHWWVRADNPRQYYCSGYDGQRIICDPDRDLVVVRLGRTPVDEVDYVWDRVFAMMELL